jgi:transcriptional regulator with XRE-family HTH domain
LKYGEKVRLIREFLGYTQKDFAIILNTKQNTLSTFEKCISEPSISIVSILFEKFNVSPCWFFNFQDEKNIFNSNNDKFDFFSTQRLIESRLAIYSKIEHFFENLLEVSYKVDNMNSRNILLENNEGLPITIHTALIYESAIYGHDFPEYFKEMSDNEITFLNENFDDYIEIIKRKTK